MTVMVSGNNPGGDRRRGYYVFDPVFKRECSTTGSRPRARLRCVRNEQQSEVVLGTFWLKANQPGLGDHVCNAAYGFARGQAGGRKMAEFSLEEARRLGFTAMQFNFVVASHTAAVRLWQSIGMEIIGTIPKAFRHKALGSTDAYIMYREL